MGRVKKPKPPKITNAQDVCNACSKRSVCRSTDRMCEKFKAAFVKSWEETTAFVRQAAEKYERNDGSWESPC